MRRSTSSISIGHRVDLDPRAGRRPRRSGRSPCRGGTGPSRSGRTAPRPPRARGPGSGPRDGPRTAPSSPAGSRSSSSTEGSSTSTGWNRRSRAASFSTCDRYSSRVVAPTSRSSPRASIGFSRLPASTAPSAAPAPTIVCSSSMKVTISPSESAISFRTAFRRSSNSPRYFAPAIIAPMSSAISRLFFSDSGTSPSTIRCARPSTIAVLPDTGLADQDGVVLRPAREHLDHPADLLVAADHGIELPRAGALGEVAAEPLERLERLLGVLRRDAMAAANLRERGEHRVPGQPRVGEQTSRRAVALQHREEDVLRGDVLVRQLLGLAAGRLEQTSGRGRQADLDPFGVDLRLRREGLVHRVAELLRDHTQLMQEREDHALRGR